MKKKYIEAPDLEVIVVSMNAMVCGSITDVDGDTDIEIANPEDEVPGEATTRRRRDVWTDEEEEESEDF